MERWRDVVGYEGMYQVSNLGRVRSMDRLVRHYRGGVRKIKSRILAVYPRNQHGHLATHLSKEGNQHTIYVHRLVAAAWIGPCPDGQQVRHGSNGLLDNSISNLCYGTPQEDAEDKWRDGTHGAKAVRRSDGEVFRSMVAAAAASGCRSQHIGAVCKGKAKTTGGYSWEYIDD